LEEINGDFLEADFWPGIVSSRPSLGQSPDPGSKFRTSDAEDMLESTFSGVRQADGSRIAHPSQPLHLNKAGK